VPAQRRASDDIANMFTRVIPQRDGSEHYVVRVEFLWNGEIDPSITLLGPPDTPIASFSRPSSRALRAVALNLQESMRLLKADIAAAIERRPAEITEPPPRHRDPL
jgi:hypothetical protein